MIKTITPYIFLSGRCEEAFAFYTEKLGAKVQAVMKYSQSPTPAPEGMLPPGFEDKVMHGEIHIGNTAVFASDGNDVTTVPAGYMLAFATLDEAEARRAYKGLSEGGAVIMPLGPTFFSPCYAMLTDKFGVGWMIMVPGGAPQE